MKNDNRDINEIKEYFVEIMNRMLRNLKDSNPIGKDSFLRYNECLYFVCQVMDKWEDLEIKNGQSVMIGQHIIE